jgi:hypothetical protein
MSSSRSALATPAAPVSTASVGRIAFRRHFQNEILSGEQAFRAFSVFDVGVRSEPFDDSSSLSNDGVARKRNQR